MTQISLKYYAFSLISLKKLKIQINDVHALDYECKNNIIKNKFFNK